MYLYVKLAHIILGGNNNIVYKLYQLIINCELLNLNNMFIKFDVIFSIEYILLFIVYQILRLRISRRFFGAVDWFL